MIRRAANQWAVNQSAANRGAANRGAGEPHAASRRAMRQRATGRRAMRQRTTKQRATKQRAANRRAAGRRAAFTLVELLVVIGIITLLASTVLLALYGAMEDARESRTRSQIAHINEQLMYRWQSYRSRAVPFRLPSGFVSMDASNNRFPQRMTPRIAAQLRLAVLRDLQRMEMPDRRLDVLDGPAALFYENDQDRNATTPGIWQLYPNPLDFNVGNSPRAAQPGLQKAYIRFIESRLGTSYPNIGAWSDTFQGAECLYMILANMQEGGTSAIDFFKSSEIGDVDGDNMPEILDAWGHPIEFIRWPAGFSAHPGPDVKWGVAGVDDDQDGIADNGPESGWLGSDDLQSPSDLQDRRVTVAGSGSSADPFDYFRVDYRWWSLDSNGVPVFTDDPFALYPLVYSAGRDGIYDILSDTTETFFSSPAPLRYTQTLRPIGMGTGLYPNDPYVAIDAQFEIGRTAGHLLSLYGYDMPSHDWPRAARTVPPNGVDNSVDNLHNHYIEVR
jgi:hypothetical protein